MTSFRRTKRLALRLGLASAFVWASGFAAAAAPVLVAPDTWLLRGEHVPDAQPDGNSVILRGPEGLIVVDSGRHAAHADALLAFAHAHGLPIVAVVNTHWHLDHVGGNPRLRAAYPGLTVHSSNAIDAALAGFLAHSREQLQSMLDAEPNAARRQAMREEIARIDAGAALRPDFVIDVSGTRSIAGRPLHLGLQTHHVTAGDVWIFDQATRVLVAGDLVTLPAPFFDTACPTRWQATLATLELQPFEHLVPGHGETMSRAQFGQYRRAFDALLECAAGPEEAHVCVEAWTAAAGSLLDGYPPGLTRGLIEYYLAQRLRGTGSTQDCPAN